MRVLVNLSKEENNYKSQLAFILGKHNVDAVSSSHTLTIGELQAKAKLAQCKAILLCNEETLANVVPGAKPTLDQWRGSVLRHDVPIVVINKLAQINTVKYGQWLLSKDIEKLAFLRNKPTPFEWTILNKVEDFSLALDQLSRAIAIAYDIETRTLNEDELKAGDTIITCASWTGIFSVGNKLTLHTYTLPLVSWEGDVWKDDGDYALALELLQKVNALGIDKAMHNGMYDCTHSIVYHAEPHSFSYDTMAMAHAEYAELPKTLDFVASYLLPDYIYWKDQAEQTAKKKDWQGYLKYNALDTWNTARIMIRQLQTVPAYALKNYAQKFHLVYPALYGNFEGLLIDQEERTSLRTASASQLAGALQNLKIKFADSSFNPGSWQQVEKYIYRVFGAQKPGIGKGGKARKKTNKKTGEVTVELGSCTDEKNLLAVQEQHPLLALLVGDILDYREAQKAIGTYYDFTQKNGRLLWSLDPFGTESERMACRASSFWCGTQVQNVPGYAKGMLIADEGYELFEADNKQSEGRTTAYLAQSEPLIAALEDSLKDFYKTLGTLFFQLDYADVSDWFRNKVLKKIVHGTNYMMGGGTFIENIGAKILFETAHKLGFTIVATQGRNYNDREFTLRKFAQYLLDLYHQPFPEIRPWYKQTERTIAETGFLVSPLGHTRKFFGDIKRDHSLLRSAVAHAPQNLSVSILNIGFRRVYDELVLPGKGDIRLKAQIHDSIFGQWRVGMADYYAPRLLACMDNPIIVHGRTLRIPVDIKYGHRWIESEKDGYVDGTKKWKAPK